MTVNQDTLKYPQRLADNLWVLGNYYFNLYLVRGTRASALIEMGVSAIVDSVIAQLDALKIEPDYLVLTHPHTDHFTGLAGLSERFPDAVMIAGEGAREFVSHPKAPASMLFEDRFISRRLAENGITPGRPPLETVTFPEKYTAVTEEIAIDLGSITLKCLPVGGHSPGNIIVHLPELDAVVAADSLGFHYPGRGFCPLFFTGYEDFLAALDQIADLKPAIIGPAHQGALTGAAAAGAVVDARRAAEDIYERVVKAHRAGRDIADDLFEEFYRAEFTLYSENNIGNCMHLLVRRALEAAGEK